MLFIPTFQTGLQPEEVECASHDTSILSLTFDQFDQTERGWRSIGEKKGCERQGAALISAYIARQRKALTRENLYQLRWHQGQLLALAGDSKEALSALRKMRETDIAQKAYWTATVAFLERDRKKLLAARRSLAEAPKPADFEVAAADYERRFGKRLVWPPNLGVVDRLISCFNGNYRAAYTGKCDD